MHRIDAYLDELVSLLDCDSLRRDEIRREVHVHLRELVDPERAKRRGADDPVAAAIERFGPAAEVDRRLNAVPRRVSARPKLEWGHPGRGIWQTVAAMVLLLT